MPGEADRRVEQAVAAVDALALVPEQAVVAADVQGCDEVAAGEALAAGRAAERDHVPVEQAGVAAQLDTGFQFGLGAGEDDAFLRQPFQGGAGLQVDLQGLPRRAGGAVPLGRAGAGELGPGAFAEAHVEGQAVAAGDAAGRMHEDVLADFRAFGVEVLLHPQRSGVAPRHRAGGVAGAGVGQLQLGVPGGVEAQVGEGGGHRSGQARALRMNTRRNPSSWRRSYSR